MNRPSYAICPNCKTESNSRSLSQPPLIESTRREYEKRLAQKDADVAKREAGVREREEAIAKAREQLDEQVTEQVRLECGRIEAEPLASRLPWRFPFPVCWPKIVGQQKGTSPCL